MDMVLLLPSCCCAFTYAACNWVIAGACVVLDGAGDAMGWGALGAEAA